MYRTHNCGALRIEHVGQKVTLSGWLNKNRDFGVMTFIDLRDRYGITQLVFNTEADEALYNDAKKLGREYVLRIEGIVAERSNKNPKIPTGDIEILVEKLEVLNESLTPPFTIDDETDGGEEIRMKYRYMDLRRRPVQEKLFFRSKVAIETRKYLSDNEFIEVETPVLIKSTPEGARDFVVPSRMNKGQFYALPQSPQTFKQLLMVSGFDKYFQLVKCFRDEDLRADRQPEFTQIDCEMSFVTQEEILQTFEGLTKYLFKECLGVELPAFPRMTYDEALKRYGSDKPDTRFGMEFVELTDLIKPPSKSAFDEKINQLSIILDGNLTKGGTELIYGTLENIKDIIISEGLTPLGLKRSIFDKITLLNKEFYKDLLKKKKINNPRLSSKYRNKHEPLIRELLDSLIKSVPIFYGSELTVGICATGQADQYSNKDIKKLTSWMQRPQIGAKGLVYVKYNLDGSIKSSVGKFYTDEQLMAWVEKFGAKKGDLLLILSGETDKVRNQLNDLRLEMGDRMGLRSGGFNPLWVIDFPLLEWDEDSERFHAMHHPFTSPKKEHMERMLNGDHDTMKSLRADAYDLVINGWEIGGGSIRIFDRELQAKNFKLLGFTDEEAEEQFGFLMGAFEYGAPPHGGIAFGFDRLCSIMKGAGSIRDFIAFPKNNQGRDVMIDAPSGVSSVQLDELGLALLKEEETPSES